MASETKPAAQGVVAGGINAHGAMGESAAPDFRRLAKHPPFQMFVEEKEAVPEGMRSDIFAYERIMALEPAARPALLDEYRAWWAAKGYWKGESPMGG